MKSNIRDTVEIAGAIAIVASLLFVGMQLRLAQQTALLDQNMALAEVYTNRTEIRSANLRALLESDFALTELVEYRQRQLIASNLGLPQAWQSEDPKISEARRIRSELIILSFDNMAFQESLGLFDRDTYRRQARGAFAADPGLKEFALNGPAIHSYTRAVFEEIAAELGN